MNPFARGALMCAFLTLIAFHVATSQAALIGRRVLLQQQGPKQHKSAPKSAQTSSKSVQVAACAIEALEKRPMLKLINEVPITGLLADTRASKKFEASGISEDASGNFWVVFDNLHALARFSKDLLEAGNTTASSQSRRKGVLVGAMDKGSSFEDLTYVPSTGNLLVVQESATHPKYGLVPVVHELAPAKDGSGYRTVKHCPVNFQLKYDNKGFEGVQYLEQGANKVLLGLCEGNNCLAHEAARIPGDGRIIVAKLNQKATNDCMWEVVKTIKLPKTACFKDYSSMALHPSGTKVAITSQESSAVWVGALDPKTLDIIGPGTVYRFPHDSATGEQMYCNVEGVHWLDDKRVVITSDKAKKDQPARCAEKGQMVSTFALP